MVSRATWKASVRILKTERPVLEAAAAQCGFSVSEFIRLATREAISGITHEAPREQAVA